MNECGVMWRDVVSGVRVCVLLRLVWVKRISFKTIYNSSFGQVSRLQDVEWSGMLRTQLLRSVVYGSLSVYYAVMV